MSNPDPDTMARSLAVLPDVGQKDDTGKLQFSLVPWDALKEIIRVLVWGAYERPRPDGTKGYGPNNWEHVRDARKRYYDALIRHVTAWYNGERNDRDSGLHHLGHAGCCLLFLLALALRGKIE